MRSLYLRIYLTGVLALALFAGVSGWLVQRHLDEQRVRAESVMRDRMGAWADLLQRSLPSPQAPADEQQQALNDWLQRLRMPMTLDDAEGRCVAASDLFTRRELDAPAASSRLRAIKLDDGRTLWMTRPGAVRAARGLSGAAKVAGVWAWCAPKPAGQCQPRTAQPAGAAEDGGVDDRTRAAAATRGAQARDRHQHRRARRPGRRSDAGPPAGRCHAAGPPGSVALLAMVAEEAARFDSVVHAAEAAAGRAVQDDERLLRRAARNLLENARRYGDGEIEVAVDSQPRLGGNDVVVRVCDRRPGVPQIYGERIFEAFFRLPGQSESEGGAGLGLGLGLVRQIASRHGGSVR